MLTFVSEFFIFQQYNVPSHWARETVDLFSVETPAFIARCRCGYLTARIWIQWSVMQAQVYKTEVTSDMKDLRQRIQTVWYQLDLRVINRAVRKAYSSTSLCCVKAKHSL